MANKQFGDTLRELRNKSGFTQQQVAEMLNLKNKSTLGSWEVGKSEPDGYTLLKLCKIYRVKDIYHAFGCAPPLEYMPDIPCEMLEKYSLLKDEFKNIVNNLILQLFELQDKGKQ